MHSLVVGMQPDLLSASAHRAVLQSCVLSCIVLAIRGAVTIRIIRIVKRAL